MREIIVGQIAVPSNIHLPEQVPALATFPIVIAGPVDCRASESKMIDDAYVDLNKVIATAQFKDAVLGATFTETLGMSSEQIYELLVTRSPISVGFTMFDGSFVQNHITHTMGYEDPNNPGICFANRHFIQDKDVCASLILHETMHVLGFSHDQVKATSVPYTMNDIYTKVATGLGV